MFGLACRLQPVQLVDPDLTRLGVGLPWQNCTSPLTFPELPAGQYGFTLRATDYAGNVATSKCARAFHMKAWLTKEALQVTQTRRAVKGASSLSPYRAWPVRELTSLAVSQAELHPGH